MNIKILVHIGFLYFFKPKYTVYFHSFGVQHIPKEINKFFDKKKLKQVYLEYRRTIQLCADIFV